MIIFTLIYFKWRDVEERSNCVPRFHLSDWMSIQGTANSHLVDSEYEGPLVESLLTFLATLMCIRTNLGT